MSDVSRAGIERVGIIGGGQMGAGIAEVFARTGREVLVSEVSVDAAAAARDRVARSLGRAVARGRLEQTQADATLALITTTTDVDDHADRDLVVEAATEDEQVKLALFERVGKALHSPEVMPTPYRTNVRPTRVLHNSARRESQGELAAGIESGTIPPTLQSIQGKPVRIQR